MTAQKLPIIRVGEPPLKVSIKLNSKFKKHRLWLMFGALVAACCFFSLTQQDNLREAVVRDEIARWHIGLGNAPLPAAVFVSIDNYDPSDNFIQRFRQNRPIVYKASQGVRRMPGDVYTQYWINPSSGLSGNRVPVGQITWVGPFMAQVKVNYPTYGSVSTVIKSFSGWKVIRRQQTWMH